MIEQAPAQPWEPVTDYSWEARKEIDGPTADLIVKTFAPKSILDYGCGHGHLVRLLRARTGETVHGFEPSGRWIQNERLQDDCYELVICREVLEHVELRDYLLVIGDICDWSSRWVYLTTRFHPNPSHLLDVATSDDLDPTHITMLNQDFLRALFVLHGFRRDRAKEQAMDWQQKGRVLVYERV